MSGRVRRQRRVPIDVVSHVVQQMQGLIDTDYPDADETTLAFQGLVRQWHTMLQTAMREDLQAGQRVGDEVL